MVCRRASRLICVGKRRRKEEIKEEVVLIEEIEEVIIEEIEEVTIEEEIEEVIIVEEMREETPLTRSYKDDAMHAIVDYFLDYIDELVRTQCPYCLDPVYPHSAEYDTHVREHNKNGDDLVGQKYKHCDYCAGALWGGDTWKEGEWIREEDYADHAADHKKKGEEKRKRCKVCLHWQYKDAHSDHENGHWSTDEVQSDTKKNCPYCWDWKKKGTKYNEHIKWHRDNKHVRQGVRSY